MLILICGLPATGKSTVARRLSKALGAEVLRTDIVRREIIDAPSYTEEEKALIYRVVFLMARYLIKNDVNVIIDGTFYRDSLRKQAQEIAGKQGKRFFLVETRCPEDIVLKRLEKRKKNLRSPSDADVDVYYKIKGLFEPIEEDHLIIDTGWNIKEGVKELVKKIKA
ncbi:MAG: adenylyl-sulfate kinase [Methanobacteriota archaeon]|nr:MAG: adenylyl-sulfate kinase [Euryarchaeota archaeon]